MEPATDQLRGPRMRTRRLLLRPLVSGDASALFAAIDDSRAELRRWLPWADGTRCAEDTLPFILSMERSNRDVVWGLWSHASGGRKSTTRVCCGCIGLHRILRDQGTATIGYWVKSNASDRGIATEAGAAVLLWAFDQLGLARIGVEAATGNSASRRVIEKLGFVPEGLLREAQCIPGRRRRLDWVIAGLVRRDVRQVRGRLTDYCGTPAPWERSAHQASLAGGPGVSADVVVRSARSTRGAVPVHRVRRA